MVNVGHQHFNHRPCLLDIFCGILKYYVQAKVQIYDEGGANGYNGDIEHGGLRYKGELSD